MAEPLSFDAPPSIPLWKLALQRGHKLGPGESVPRIEVVLPHLPPGDATAYATLCGFAQADPLPPTWPMVRGADLHKALLTHKDFPLPAMGIVHVAQTITQHRPIGAGETLGLRAWVEGHRPARRGGEIDLHTEASVGGETVWEAVTTVLSKALPGDGVKREPPPDVEFRPTRSVSWTLPEDLGRRYAAVSGDYNPIHLHKWSAKAFGFPRAIAHGLWTLARLLAELDEEIPPAFRFEARFARPLLLPGVAVFDAGPDASGALHFRVSAKGKRAVSGSLIPGARNGEESV